MNKELIKQAFQLGYRVGLEKVSGESADSAADNDKKDSNADDTKKKRKQKLLNFLLGFGLTSPDPFLHQATTQQLQQNQLHQMANDQAIQAHLQADQLHQMVHNQAIDHALQAHFQHHMFL